jgi:hypothetical protein
VSRHILQCKRVRVSDSATRGCEGGNPSVVMDLDVEEKAREIRLTFCGAISGKEAQRYAPERQGRSGGARKPRGRPKAVTRDQGGGWGKPFLAGAQRSRGESMSFSPMPASLNLLPLGKSRRNISTNSSASTSRELCSRCRKSCHY